MNENFIKISKNPNFSVQEGKSYHPQNLTIDFLNVFLGFQTLWTSLDSPRQPLKSPGMPGYALTSDEPGRAQTKVAQGVAQRVARGALY